jgi:integration host factor subunit beta
MATRTKKELIDRIAEHTGAKRVQVKRVVQQFLDEVVSELGNGNRLEFRDFGVFETKVRKARKAQNPKTLEPVEVPEKRTVKFKVGRLMKQRLAEMTGAAIDDEAKDIAEMSDHSHDEEEHEEEEQNMNEQAGT